MARGLGFDNETQSHYNERTNQHSVFIFENPSNNRYLAQHCVLFRNSVFHFNHD